MPKKMYPESEYPIYEIYIGEDDDTGIRLVSLVKDPAIEVVGMAFQKEENIDYQFKSIQDKQMIIGPALIPNKKIIRKDEDGDPYFVFFSEETIRLMVAKFNKENTGKSINIDHTNEMAPAFIMENWIVEDSYYDKSRKYGFNLPVGSWVIMAKVEDENFWSSEVKDMGRYSFSVEGLMGQSISSYSFNDIIDSLSDEEVFDIVNSLKKRS